MATLSILHACPLRTADAPCKNARGSQVSASSHGNNPQHRADECECAAFCVYKQHCTSISLMLSWCDVALLASEPQLKRLPLCNIRSLIVISDITLQRLATLPVSLQHRNVARLSHSEHGHHLLCPSVDNVMSDEQDVTTQQTGSASDRIHATDRDAPQTSTSRPLLRFETGVAVASCGPVAGA